MSAENDDFNVLQFEKKLTSLKDSQESINSCCQWCLSNRQHHKKIVNSWLNVLKRVKVEHRLILFYLANDVIQYSKRRKYEYVESWGTALQKATTLVRDDRVKQKIERIFKIWEDRGVYSEEFISDLCGLISVTPTAPKNDEPHEFQPNYVINKIRVCSNLESDTDLKLKKLKELNPKILETDSYYSSLKDRAHLDDTEKELDTYAKHMEDYINALKTEIKNRITLISVLKQAEGQLDNDRKDVKIVANAYKSFGTRVKTFQKKLEEHKANLVSPIPSPDINAPSPTSDSDIDLPDPASVAAASTAQDSQSSNPQKTEIDFLNVQITNANYYNPVPAPTADSGSQFVANGFTSFIGSNLPFNVQNFNSSNLSSTNGASQGSASHPGLISGTTDDQSTVNLMQPPPLPKNDPYGYPNDPHSNPLLPPPMPSFGLKDDSSFGRTTSYDGGFEADVAPDYGSTSFNASASYATDQNYAPDYGPTPDQNSSYDPIASLFGQSGSAAFEPPIGANPYPPSDEYNPEEELQTWDGDMSWTQPPPLDNTDTPESPPPFEKESYSEPIEYHDNLVNSGASDVDQRVLPPALKAADKLLGRGQDVDHRNLISLIGSPATDSNSNQLPGGDVMATGDQDYRGRTNVGFPTNGGDQDYRLPFDIEQQLKLPPPPPPPTSTNSYPFLGVMPHKKHGANFLPQDNVESIDMDLSDGEAAGDVFCHKLQRDNLKVVVDAGSIHGSSSIGSNSNVQSIRSPEEFDSHTNSQDGLMPTFDGVQTMLEPPPPLPELPDDAEENLLLDQMNNDLNDFLLHPDEVEKNLPEPFWNNNPPPNHLQQPPPLFTSLPPPPIAPISNWPGEEPYDQFNRHNKSKRGKFNNSFRGGRGNRGGFKDPPSYNDHVKFNDPPPYNDHVHYKDPPSYNEHFQFKDPPHYNDHLQFNDRPVFNDNPHYNRGGGNMFRGRGRGGNHPRFHRGGNFRGFRGNRGCF